MVRGCDPMVKEAVPKGKEAMANGKEAMTQWEHNIFLQITVHALIKCTRLFFWQVPKLLS